MRSGALNCDLKEEGRCGTGSARAFCVLDRINGVCRALPIKGVTGIDCVLLSSYGRWEEMDQAIQDVIGPDDCLSFFEGSDPNDDLWGSVGTGFLGCQ
jgi:hypothetical protein